MQQNINTLTEQAFKIFSDNGVRPFARDSCPDYDFYVYLFGKQDAERAENGGYIPLDMNLWDDESDVFAGPLLNKAKNLEEHGFAKTVEIELNNGEKITEYPVRP